MIGGEPSRATDGGYAGSRGGPSIVQGAAGPPRAGGEQRGVPGARQAVLRLRRVDPWSVMKVSVVLAATVGLVLVVAVVALWWALDSWGVFQAAVTTVDQVAGSGTGSTVVAGYLGFSTVLGLSLVLWVVDVVLITALATLGAVVYNVVAALTGGLEVTLRE
ncbi:MAG: DUF3566 domain-containing protein [Actinomycetes bacterium]